VRKGPACKTLLFFESGKLKGEYYNINTPVELYPYGARYIDLEIDVVRRAGEPPFIVDREDLAILLKEGKISQQMERKRWKQPELCSNPLTRGLTEWVKRGIRNAELKRTRSVMECEWDREI